MRATSKHQGLCLFASPVVHVLSGVVSVRGRRVDCSLCVAFVSVRGALGALRAFTAACLLVPEGRLI
eukprot:19257-Heterococcus_DN1.PRE.3